MADDVERAAEITAAWNERCVRALRQAPPGQSHCEACEAEIPARRREAYPQARRCVRCQEQVERKRA